MENFETFGRLISVNICDSFRIGLYSRLSSMLRVFIGEIFNCDVLLDITRGFCVQKILNACFFYEILIVLTLWLVIVIVILWLVFHPSFVLSFFFLFQFICNFFDYFLFEFYTCIIIIIII